MSLPPPNAAPPARPPSAPAAPPNPYVAPPRASSAGRTVATVLAVIASVIVVVALVAAVALWLLVRSFTHHDLPECSAPPVAVEWTDAHGTRTRSQTFTFEQDTVVQIDAIVHGDNPAAIFPSWGGIKFAPADFDVTRLDRFDAAWERSRPVGSPPTTLEPPPTDRPYDELVVVGKGVDAINEQVTVPAGDWVLLADFLVGPTELRSPC